MPLQLPDRPAQHFIDEILLPSWTPSDALGYDPSVNTPSDDEFLPVGTTLDDVGAVYPSLVVTYSNETSGGQSTYDFIGENGPGQFRVGTLVVTARAEARPNEGHTGDPNSFSAVDGEDAVVALIEEVQNTAMANAAGGPTSNFQTVGPQRGPDAPHDYDVDPTVYLANTQILYTYLSQP